MNYEQTLTEARKIIESFDEPGGHIINRPRITAVLRELVEIYTAYHFLDQAIDNVCHGASDKYGYRSTGDDVGNDINDEYRLLRGEVKECAVCEVIVEPEDRYSFRVDYPPPSELWATKSIDELHTDCFTIATDEQLIALCLTPENGHHREEN